MADALAALKKDIPFELAVLDIDADAALADRFNDLVPVLMHGDRELARYRLDSGSVRAYLAQIR
jgi:glutathione S-transferase